jgi:hypothetical protein
MLGVIVAVADEDSHSLMRLKRSNVAANGGKALELSKHAIGRSLHGGGDGLQCVRESFNRP